MDTDSIENLKATKNSLEEKVNYVKELLSSQKSHIKLHDFAIEEVREFFLDTSEDNFSVSGDFSDEEFLRRISSYEKCTKDLGAIFAVMAYWATDSELEVLIKIISRVSDRLIESPGGSVWSNLRWYPLLLLLYQAGIAAVESKNYQALSTILYTKLGDSGDGNREPYFVQKLSNGVDKLVNANVFKCIPGYEEEDTPISEYLFKQTQPGIDNLFFLGKGYEASFDEFEILYALVVADLRRQTGHRLWAPTGRFGWKLSSEEDNSPFVRLTSDAANLKEQWPPIKAGMFGGCYERFEKEANAVKEDLEGRNWRVL